MTARLNVNIDHVATVRQARRAPEPSLVAAAMISEQAGADGITVHLRGDRRHIQDADLFVLRQAVTTYLNVEMAATEEMMKVAIDVKPDAVSLVPENPKEITTEGGLNVRTNIAIVRAAVSRLREMGVLASLFIDPDPFQIEAAQIDRFGFDVELVYLAHLAQLRLGEVAVRWDHSAGGPLDASGNYSRDSLRMINEVRRIRASAAAGDYSEAISAARTAMMVEAKHGLAARSFS